MKAAGDAEYRPLPPSVPGGMYTWDHPGALLASAPCHCITERQAEQRKQKSVNSILNGVAGVPEDFRGYSFETWDALPSNLTTDKRVAREAAGCFAAGEVAIEGIVKYGLVLSGPVGTSKSGLASCILMARAQAGQSVLWIDYLKFLRKVKATYDQDSETTYDEIISAAATVGCLLFDDFGDAKAIKLPTDHVRQIVYEVIGERYNEHRPTMITTNLSQEMFLDQFQDRIYSRVLRMCYWQDCGRINIRKALS